MDDDEIERMFAASRPSGLHLKSFDQADAEARAKVTRALDDRVVRLMGTIVAPIIGEQVKALRANNAALERRVSELENKLDTDGRLRDVEQRLAALSSGGPRRVA